MEGNYKGCEMREVLQNHLAFFVLLGVWGIGSLIALFLFWLDKKKSIKDKPRVSEKTLLLWSVVGSLGALWGIYKLRHKSKHFYFSLVALESCVLNVLILWMCF